MVVIGIIAILAAIAVPDIISRLPNYRLKEAARDLVSNMQKAKMEAVKRNKDVIIALTETDYSTQNGKYLIFVDDNASNGSFDTGEHIVAEEDMPKNVFLYNSTFTGDTTGFNSRALPNKQGSIFIRNNKSRYYRVSLSFAGNIRLRMSSDGTNWN
jgi:type IV fimbrial biogenesis protein FimT